MRLAEFGYAHCMSTRPTGRAVRPARARMGGTMSGLDIIRPDGSTERQHFASPYERAETVRAVCAQLAVWNGATVRSATQRRTVLDVPAYGRVILRNVPTGRTVRPAAPVTTYRVVDFAEALTRIL